MNSIREKSQELCKEMTGHTFVSGQCKDCGATCTECDGTGYITVDTFNGEHDQYQSLCICMMPAIESEDASEQYARNKYNNK